MAQHVGAGCLSRTDQALDLHPVLRLIHPRPVVLLEQICDRDAFLLSAGERHVLRRVGYHKNPQDALPWWGWFRRGSEDRTELAGQATARAEEDLVQVGRERAHVQAGRCVNGLRPYHKLPVNPCCGGVEGEHDRFATLQLGAKVGRYQQSPEELATLGLHGRVPLGGQLVICLLHEQWVKRYPPFGDRGIRGDRSELVGAALHPDGDPGGDGVARLRNLEVLGGAHR